MKEEEEEAPLEDPCVCRNCLAQERHAAQSEEQHAVDVSQGQLTEVCATMCRLQRRSPPLRLHVSPKWLREKLHSQRAIV
jgi:hypothetical protein